MNVRREAGGTARLVAVTAGSAGPRTPVGQQIGAVISTGIPIPR
jgi:hypothetical protein